MAVGKLTVKPENIRDLPSNDLNDARLFVGCYIQESEKHRTQTESGPRPYWKDTLVCNVPESQNYLNLELIDENPNQGGILATGRAPLKLVFEQGNETQWVQLKSTSNNQPFGELKLNLTFNGSSSVSNVTSSFGQMNLADGQRASYNQTSSYNQTTTTSFKQNEGRQNSYSSLGPDSPIPENYGSGNPPPFKAPNSSASYAGGNNNNFTTSNNLVNEDGVVDPQTMSQSEFEEAKEKGHIPKWAKYGGGVLAGAAALGLAAWGAHEAKEHYDKKKQDGDNDEQTENIDTTPFVPPSGYLQPESQQQPYTIENQQRKEQSYDNNDYNQGQRKEQSYNNNNNNDYTSNQEQRKEQSYNSNNNDYSQQQRQEYSYNNNDYSQKQKESSFNDYNNKSSYQTPKYQENNNEYNRDHNKKEKKHKKHGGRSDSSDSDSSDSDNERKQHGKKKDKEWY